MLVGAANSANANHAILVVISYCNNTAGTSIEAIHPAKREILQPSASPCWRELQQALFLTQTFSHTAQGDKPVDGQLQKPFPAFLSDAGSGVEIFFYSFRCVLTARMLQRSKAVCAGTHAAPSHTAYVDDRREHQQEKREKRALQRWDNLHWRRAEMERALRTLFVGGARRFNRSRKPLASALVTRAQVKKKSLFESTVSFQVRIWSVQADEQGVVRTPDHPD